MFDGEGLTYIDSAGVAAIEELARRLRADGITMVTARLKGRCARFDQTGLTAALGTGHHHATVRAAVDACSQKQRLQHA